MSEPQKPPPPGQHQWHIDEDMEQAGKQRIIGRGDSAGFSGQRDNGSPKMLLLVLLVPIILLLIYAVISWLR